MRPISRPRQRTAGVGRGGRARRRCASRGRASGSFRGRRPGPASSATGPPSGPGSTAPGSAAAQGTSTKARRWARGCGRVSSGSATTRSPTVTTSTSRVRAPHRSPRRRWCARSRSWARRSSSSGASVVRAEDDGVEVVRLGRLAGGEHGRRARQRRDAHGLESRGVLERVGGARAASRAGRRGWRRGRARTARRRRAAGSAGRSPPPPPGPAGGGCAPRRRRRAPASGARGLCTVTSTALHARGGRARPRRCARRGSRRGRPGPRRGRR